MAHEAENEAKQLDSVTDRHQEMDFDENKAKEAMSALSSAADGKAGESDSSNTVVKVSKEDVAVIVNELEVTEDEAKAALRAAAAEVGEGKSPVAAALRRLVVS